MKRTDRQIHEAVGTFRREHGYSPTVRELCGMCGISSTSAMHSRIVSMEAKGMLMRGKGFRTLVELDYDWGDDG